MPHDVFISYSTSDKSVADAACAKLENQKIRCWIAPRDVLPGTEYGEAIVDGINACSVFVIVFSMSANESPYVNREVERAISKGKVIVPFRIEAIRPTKSMEFFLGNTHWLDALTPPIETFLDQLARTILRLLNPNRGTDVDSQPSLRLTVHFACFSGANAPCCFINATNLCQNIDLEITHVWIESQPKVYALNKSRPLPKRLKPHETWETWIPFQGIPYEFIRDGLYQLARVRLSTGEIVSSFKNEGVPEMGSVPGGPITTD